MSGPKHSVSVRVCVLSALTQSQTQRVFQIDLWQLLWPRHFQHLNIDLEGKQSQYAVRNILFPNCQRIPSTKPTT